MKGPSPPSRGEAKLEGEPRTPLARKIELVEEKAGLVEERSRLERTQGPQEPRLLVPPLRR